LGSFILPSITVFRVVEEGSNREDRTFRDCYKELEANSLSDVPKGNRSCPDNFQLAEAELSF
jgi:hypothetical protein